MHAAQTLAVGFVGLGAMGEPMAIVLRQAKMPVIGFDLRPDVLARLHREHGILPATSPADLMSRCDTVITMLPTSQHLEQLLFAGSGGGAAAQLRRGSLLVDMSSGDPAITRSIGKRLAEREVVMVDAPVSGNVVRARKGDLAIMLGGSDAACQRAEPILKPMARTVFRTGALGSGQAMKALNNLCSAAGFWIASEALTIGKKAGLDPEVMLEVLNASTGANNSTQNKFKPFVLSGTYAGNFLLQLMVKDLRIAAAIAAQAGVEAPLTESVAQHWRTALETLGPSADHTEVARLIADNAGVTLNSH